MKHSLYFCSMLLLITSALFSTASCVYNVEEVLYPSNICETTDVSYANVVEPILINNCYVCHAEGVAQGGIVVESYNNLKVHVDNGRFLGAIRHDPGFSPMPQSNPKLSDCNITKIAAWIAQGALDN